MNIKGGLGVKNMNKYLSSIRLIFLYGIILVVNLTLQIQGAEYPPVNHGGADLTLSDGDFIWGVHTGIKRLTILENAVVKIMPYNGIADSARGMVALHAESVELWGTLTAEGSGYTGGGGGGGGGASVTWSYEHHWYSSSLGPYEGGHADYGDETSGFDGSSGSMNHYGGDITPGGFPGHGDGVYGGWQPLSGMRDGGYMAAGANGDMSDDDFTTMGCGGGGGQGGDGWIMFNPLMPILGEGLGGGGGGRGGGCIRIYATNSFIMGSEGMVDASDVMGGNADWCFGGNVSPPQEGLGGDIGGAGAGGGVLLQLESASSVNIQNGATIRTLGGGSMTENGGSAKIRFNTSGWINNGTITARRICINGGCGSSVIDWDSY